ncbi:hypothetical protein FQA39_LY10192 [Lamprigera yunnana]|nr:hypothetical protein FQA39_LY10192 [Lamprigera yunnana]
MDPLIHIAEERVRTLLHWNSTFKAMEMCFVAVSRNQTIQNPRTITQLSENNVIFTMPGYLKDEETSALGCKILSYFSKNENVPTIMANILLMDDLTGTLKAVRTLFRCERRYDLSQVIAGTEITSWRTAGASAVATTHLHKKDKKILAIIGAGTQGKTHAVAFNHFFKFEEVRVWNRTAGRAEELAKELDNGVSCGTAEECVKNADVVVTTTGIKDPLVKLKWLKKGVHINVSLLGVVEMK